MADTKNDPRSPEEIATAQKSLVKILAFATGVPVIFVVLMAWSLMQGTADLDAAEQSFGTFMGIWGLLTPVVWLGSNGYTYLQINRGNMEAGRFLPLVPAFWVIFWFAALYTR